MIRLLEDTHDIETNKPYKKGTEVDLGKVRNENAIKAGKAEWVKTEAKGETLNEKKETQKKTGSVVKGKKIETK